MAIKEVISSIYNLYMGDMKRGDIAQLIKTEAPEVYRFYLSSITRTTVESNSRFKITGALIKDAIKAVLMKLTPLRRIAFTLSIALFFWGSFNRDWFYGFISFILLLLMFLFEVAAKIAYSDELEQAREIQARSVPEAAPKIYNYDIAFYTKTARTVGGDYIEFFKSSVTKRYFLAVGDISGKGMGAALYMLQVRSILSYLVEKFSDIKIILADLNEVIFKLFDKKSFFTLAFAEIKNDRLIVARAGHTPIIHFSAETDSIQRIMPKGLACGMTSTEIFSKFLETTEVVVKPNDILLFYTDGLNETMNAINQEFGEERIFKILEKYKDKSSNELVNLINTYLIYFRDDAHQHDDVTFVIIKVI